MRNIGSPTTTALAQRKFRLRDFFYIVVKDGSNNPVSAAYWNGKSNITTNVISGSTGSSVSRTYVGIGKLINVDDIPLTNDLNIRTVSAYLNYLDDNIRTLLYGYNLRWAQVEVHRMLFDPVTSAVVEAQLPRLVGYVSHVELVEPSEGSYGHVKFDVVGRSWELSLPNNLTRSNASAHLRDATDDFYQYTPQMAKRTLYWGVSHGTPAGTSNQATRVVQPLVRRGIMF